jgi:hypothetical protein
VRRATNSGSITAATATQGRVLTSPIRSKSGCSGNVPERLRRKNARSDRLVTYDLMSSDHAFTAFLAGSGDRFEGDEYRMFQFFKRHPGMEAMRATESALEAYAKGRK